VGAYASPWFLPWQIILIVFILYRIQLLVLKNCILSLYQFGDQKETFWYYYLEKIFPRINKRYLDIVTDDIMPVLVVILAFIIQN